MSQATSVEERRPAGAIGAAQAPVVEEFAIANEARFPESDEPTLWSYVTPVVAEVTIDDRFHPRRAYHRGDMRLTAPGVRIHRVSDEPTVIRSLQLPRRVFEDFFGERSADATRRSLAKLQDRAFQSPLVSSIFDRLHAEVDDPSPVGQLYRQSLLQSAALELWRLGGGDAAPLGPLRAGLDPAALRALDRYVDSHLAEKIESRDLARLVDMPPASFQRAFRDATGKTPYQHVLGRRLERARCQVERSGLSLAEIAFRTGFASQSHMTDVFRAKLGLTPGAIRKALA